MIAIMWLGRVAAAALSLATCACSAALRPGVSADGGTSDGRPDSGPDASAPDAGASDGGRVVDPGTLAGKLMMGYQGWFACPGDGSPLSGWLPWVRGNGSPPLHLWAGTTEPAP